MLDTDNHLNAQALAEHLRAIAGRDVGAFMAGYAEDAVLLMPDASVPFAYLRGFVEQFFQALPEDGTVLDITRQEVTGDIAYVVWSAESPYLTIPLAADTFIFREGKIAVHTFGGQMIPRNG